MFEKDDWSHLAKIDNSGKKDQVLKVGRFGLGFLSVFHITGELYFKYLHTQEV